MCWLATRLTGHQPAQPNSFLKFVPAKPKLHRLGALTVVLMSLAEADESMKRRGQADVRSTLEKKRPKYGVDRPDLIFVCSSGGIVWIALAAILHSSGALPASLIAFVLVLGLVVVGVLELLLAIAFVFSSLIMKFRQRDDLLDSIDWHGVQSVLDVGCGPGLLLIGAAKRVAAAGKAVGVDIWLRRAESGNRAERTLENAELEGVAEKVEVRDGDVRSLTFPDSTFDVVLSRAVL